MKTLILFFTTSCLGILNNGCKKASDESFTISGRIYQGCSTTPLANQEISFFQRVSTDWSLQTSGGELGVTTTDINGNFSFAYSPQNDNDLRIQLPAGFGFNPIITGVPGKQTIKDLSINYYPSSTIQVRLNVLKPYSVNDTLYISDFRNSTFLKLAGPLNSGLLYNSPNFRYDNFYNNGNSASLKFKIGNNSNWITKDFKLISCDTSRVIVDIN